ncbi:hypothetical protein DXG03_006884 [Asterophora parasitica]|uniref:Signal recognition particle SRP72 subunit RNA-binding domain-containing protein n=1 Tax=Asterophora parasitica TaxID=117018 RepID=A0A9P7KAF9_9AGAR|nr:hypothetical protein DXG03_006884 [Asterophora parasitica]
MATKAATTGSKHYKGNKEQKQQARSKTPKQPLSTPERLRRLFTSLCAQIDGGHFSNAIKTCEKSSYSDAVELYTQLLETADPDSEEHSDIQTNLHAAQLHLEFTTSGFLRSLPTSSIPTSIPIPTASAAPGPTTTTTTTTTVPTEKKKVRQSRVPIGVIPGVTPPPDPERWLKKSERTTFGQGRRRKGHSQGAGGATQGSAGVESTAPAASGSGKTGGKGGSKKKK